MHLISKLVLFSTFKSWSYFILSGFCLFLPKECVAEEVVDIQIEPRAPDVTLSTDWFFTSFALNLKLNDSDGSVLANTDVSQQKLFRPEISLFTTNHELKTYHLGEQYSVDSIVRRQDRYKNSIPAIFRMTLKGYSVVEYSNQKTDTWSLNKIENKAFRKPEIMFSVTKHF